MAVIESDERSIMFSVRAHAYLTAVAALALVLAGAASSIAAERAFDCVIDPSTTVKLGSPVSGILSDVLVARGDWLRAGQAVAELESRVEETRVALNRARAESTARIDAQTARLEFARARLGRASQLIERQIVAKDRFEELQADRVVAEQELLREQQERSLAKLELERSEALLEQRTIRSPISGAAVEN